MGNSFVKLQTNKKIQWRSVSGKLSVILHFFYRKCYNDFAGKQCRKWGKRVQPGKIVFYSVRVFCVLQQLWIVNIQLNVICNGKK